jgi:hypothetical protein
MLLTEYLPFKYNIQTINESINNNGKLIVTGVLQRANAKNHNGRIYPKAILEREVQKYINTEIKENRALGELDHPDSSVINLKNVSHNIIEMRWNGDDVIGTVEVLNTPSGNILKELFKAGVTLGISSRGMGSVQQVNEDTSEVQDDFSLLCWDFVSNPSTHGAFLYPIKEGKENNLNENYQYANELIRDIICELAGKCEIC